MSTKQRQTQKYSEPTTTLYNIPTPKQRKKVDVVEVFSPARITAHANRMGLTPGIAVDLRTGWDLDLKSHREALWKYLYKVKPYLVVGSPECKAFSLMAKMNKGHESYKKV